MPGIVPRGALYECQTCGGVKMYYGGTPENPKAANYHCENCGHQVGPEVGFEYAVVILKPDTQIGG